MRPVAREWLLKRNCALSPLQLVFFYLTLVFVSLLIGTAFALLGAWPILPFSGVEMLALGVALWVYARHATDHERVLLNEEALIVETVNAGSTTVMRLNPLWVQVVTETGFRTAVFLREQGRRIAVGRHLDEVGRKRFAHELRRALAGWCGRDVTV
ncbi:MAG: DUF2244 domain-containing protein [Burkholderiaceae bacterium]